MTAPVAPRTVPVTIVTGFLGAGKTTLIGHLLRRPELARTAVLINEVGAVAIDHHLVREVRGDAIVLASGCVCCTVAGDLVRALVELYGQAARGEVPRFERVLLETTGLADPTAVVATLLQQPLLAQVYRPGAVVTVVDGVAGAATLAAHPEASAQIALADRLIVSKIDLADPAAVAGLEHELRRRNRGAELFHAAGEVAPEVILAPAAGDDERGAGLKAWIAASATAATPATVGAIAPAATHPSSVRPGRGLAGAHPDVTTFAVALDRPVRMGPLSLWLSIMTQMHGGALLRVKGLVAAVGEERPFVIQTVQHLALPARQLPAWPDDDHRTRLVFIARGLPASTLASLRASLADTLDQPVIEL